MSCSGFKEGNDNDENEDILIPRLTDITCLTALVQVRREAEAARQNDKTREVRVFYLSETEATAAHVRATHSFCVKLDWLGH